jgi:hypothetical protein
MVTTDPKVDLFGWPGGLSPPVLIDCLRHRPVAHHKPDSCILCAFHLVVSLGDTQAGARRLSVRGGGGENPKFSTQNFINLPEYMSFFLVIVLFMLYKAFKYKVLSYIEI